MIRPVPPRLAVLLAAAHLSCAGDGGKLFGRLELNQCPVGPTAETCNDDPEPCLSPEADGSVVLTQATERIAISDADGFYHLADLSAGRYGLAVAVAETVEVRRVDVVDITDDGAPAPLHFTFTAAGTIQGMIAPPEDFDGTDLSGFDVSMACPPRSAVTDARGAFRLERVPIGERHLSATGPGLVTPETQVVTLTRGAVEEIELALIAGRPPEEPGNLPPQIDEPIAITPLSEPAGEEVYLRPPHAGVVRGESVALTCDASDPDGDRLQYVWSASSGSLEAESGPDAVWTAGAEDAGISCNVLDGRGGIDGTHTVLTVHDSYFGGAALTGEGAIMSSAYGGEFDLVRWSPTRKTRWSMAASQWLPDAESDLFAYIDRATGGQALFGGVLPPAPDALPTVDLLDAGADAFTVTRDAVVWLDSLGTARAWDRTGGRFTVGGGYGERLAASGRILALDRNGDSVQLLSVQIGGAVATATLTTPDRQGNTFATDGTRVVYWGAGRPMLATATSTVELGPDQAFGGRGRILLDGDRAAYSFYDSPLDFIEATVVVLQGDQVTARERVAVGPSEVLDLDGDRLLIGRPRSEEDEPSRDLWILDLGLLGIGP